MKNLIIFISLLALGYCDDVIDLSKYEKISENFTCGTSNTSSASYTIVNYFSQFLQKDQAIVCIVLADQKSPRKVVFNPRIDNFELLQVQGFFDVSANLTDGDFRLFAMSNGIKSRPILYKRNDKVAQILNLRISMDDGFVEKIEWINVCDSLACEENVCIDTEDNWRNETFKDSNCFLYGCTSSANSDCDTKIYLTWIGTDREGRVFTSDNYRVSNFMDYSLNTLLSSAQGIGSGIYKKFYDPSNNPTISAHPARFSPDDPFSEQRMKCKERFNLLITQKPPIQL
ncbi:h aca ribonucleoprotein complex subunit 3 [Stylonychia lemnae]|uniref:Nucleolar protein 10 n=1 Tax=Stylonychia lemnae TaxID=5949 RepID=A0A078AEL4_STYLE|nr:h aca ribonucleoprotein complex subunit 3 [Stylonychia lemnae]|eukprot:CDW79912.1 h aca ribonucleoprotein complex subunit 3 [Stylonychia lemnae]